MIAKKTIQLVRFEKIGQHGIKGEATDVNHKDEVELLGWSWEFRRRSFRRARAESWAERLKSEISW